VAAAEHIHRLEERHAGCKFGPGCRIFPTVEEHKEDVSDRSGEPGGVSPRTLEIAAKNPGAEAARLT